MAATLSHRRVERGHPAVKRISVIGLGKLGLCLAAVLADRGFKVVGVDVDKQKVAAVMAGRSPIYEPGLEALLGSNRTSLTATTDYDAAVRGTEATFVVVPTPSTKSGEFSLEYVKPVMGILGKALVKKPTYHLVVLTSTVTPGSMDEVVLPTLEKTSGKKGGRDFGLCYNPEFIALGDVVKGLLTPDFVLVGESDPAAGDMLAEIQLRTCANGTPIARMSFMNAEVAKIAVNSFVTMKMSFANTLAEICERVPGGDVDAITRAIGMDRRIGSAYLRGAIGYGGPCFPRDNVAFAAFAKRIGVDAALARATDKVNRRQVRRIVKLIENHGIAPPSKIGVLGFTYKPNTNVTEASQGLMLAEALARKGYRVHAYDPAIGSGQLPNRQNLILEDNVDACVEKSDLCVIATPWQGFSTIDKSRFSDKVVLDCWRVLNGNRPSRDSAYMALGQSMTRKKVLRGREQ